MDYRKAYGLPERYFLSLGRMVEKKNLATLIAAYGKFCNESRVASDKSGRQEPVALVFVGSGELEGVLREQARALGLRVVDRMDWKAGSKRQETKRLKDEETDDCKLTAESSRQASHRPTDADDSVENDRGAVYFYGFRQIEENPVFYALAEAFVLPSLKEEWGLVVNEAMAAGLPVIVSRTAGCAEDLVPEAPASRSSQLADGSVQSGENAESLNPQRSTLNSLEERSNGFVFDPKASDALSKALRRIADQETNSRVFETARGRAEGKLNDQETNGLTEMGKRSREIVAKFSCENFAQQALRAAEIAEG